MALTSTLSIHDGDHETLPLDFWQHAHTAVMSHGTLSLLHQIALVDSPRKIEFANRQAIVESSSGLARLLPFVDLVGTYVTDDDLFPIDRDQLEAVIRRSTPTESIALEVEFDENTPERKYIEFDKRFDELAALRARTIAALAGTEEAWIRSIARRRDRLGLTDWYEATLSQSSLLDTMLSAAEHRIAQRQIFRFAVAPDLTRFQRRVVEAMASEMLPVLEELVEPRVAVCVVSIAKAESVATLDGNVLRLEVGLGAEAAVIRYVVKKALGLMPARVVQYARGRA